MSCCTNRARALILSSCEDAEAVSVDAFCLISDEASIRPLVRLRYQAPISFQLLNPLKALNPPGGRNDTTICPITPFRGGISVSLRTPFTSRTTHCH